MLLAIERGRNVTNIGSDPAGRQNRAEAMLDTDDRRGPAGMGIEEL
jgi:hypothetical protein